MSIESKEAFARRALEIDVEDPDHWMAWLTLELQTRERAIEDRCERLAGERCRELEAKLRRQTERLRQVLRLIDRTLDELGPEPECAEHRCPQSVCKPSHREERP